MTLSKAVIRPPLLSVRRLPELERNTKRQSWCGGPIAMSTKNIRQHRIGWVGEILYAQVRRIPARLVSS